MGMVVELRRERGRVERLRMELKQVKEKSRQELKQVQEKSRQVQVLKEMELDAVKVDRDAVKEVQRELEQCLGEYKESLAYKGSHQKKILVFFYF